MSQSDTTFTLEDAEFMYRPNFAGRPTKFNPEGGERKIDVKVKEEQVEALRADGWNIKRAKTEGDTPGDAQNYTGDPYIPIEVSFKFKAPRIMQVTSRGGTILDDELCYLLDSADIEKFDVVIRAYDWTVNGNNGRKAYLKTFVGFIAEDYLEQKYADLFSGASGALPENDDDGEEGVPWDR